MIPLFFLQLTVLLLTAWPLGWLAKRFKLPAMLGEITGGILLGPSLLGSAFPSLFNSVFESSPEAVGMRVTFIKIAVLCFLFLAGTETRLESIKKRSGAISISLFGILIPFILGVASVWVMPNAWSRFTEIGTFKFSIFLGTALSISALPVIARILMDLKLMQTEMAGIVLAAASFDDLVGWSLLSWILISSSPHLHLQEFAPLIVFWTGVALSGYFQKNEKSLALFSPLIMNFMIPIYFVSLGLKINFISYFDLPLASFIFFIACLGKIAGVLLGGWIGKMKFRETLNIAFAMNARGAMEILLASLALEAGLIQAPLFVALVFMAVGTSVLAGLFINPREEEGRRGKNGEEQGF